MSKRPNYRSRVWNLLRTARATGQRGIALATLAAVMGANPGVVMAAMMPDMLETPEGAEAPPIYCQPTDDGPTLCPRRFPGTEGA